MASAALLLVFMRAHEPASGHDIYTELDGPAPTINELDDRANNDDNFIQMVPADGGGYETEDQSSEIFKDNPNGSGLDVSLDTMEYTQTNGQKPIMVPNKKGSNLQYHKIEGNFLSVKTKQSKAIVPLDEGTKSEDEDEDVFSLTVECPNIDGELPQSLKNNEDLRTMVHILHQLQPKKGSRQSAKPVHVQLEDKTISVRCCLIHPNSGQHVKFPSKDQNEWANMIERIYGNDFIPKKCGKAAAASTGQGMMQIPGFPLPFMNAMMFGMNGFPPYYPMYVPLPMAQPQAYQYPNPMSVYPPGPIAQQYPLTGPVTKSMNNFQPSSNVDIDGIANFPFIHDWLHSLNLDKWGSCGEQWQQYVEFLTLSGIHQLNHLVAGSSASQLAEMCQMLKPLADHLYGYGQIDLEKCHKEALKVHKQVHIV
ncbi:hypothetical protein BS47DRAFT_1364755 [Hydnum rufescens UP504]|uniref:Uncharacterized protein n=1 Tax=Hydnum rufescens UP504 TaxID=1448309 RepID=A0A9P6DU11_9AGAM|nr:hypothetical protein BS47DRAFT_1364755 [Hydnum rufescens UP504]